jgi:NADH-quinone oxidoreductase subunit G
VTKVFIDNQEVEVPEGSTVFQACQASGTEIPHFCYHDRLAIAGNCRMCLVEVENAPKPVASCAYPVQEGMKVFTSTEKVHKARKGVMEFLLINHPLDCPICDQGGECDLQDEAMAYGFDRGRYSEAKRAVEDKDMGPLVKTNMTRCIHCTRCVRFLTDVAGTEELGALGRGEHMEIMPIIENSFSSELSGNIIDLCPVGALTSKPYAFTARSWELQETPSIDVHDALGTNIVIHTKGPEVMRIVPRLNESINEEWLSDKGRFSYDGLKRQRLDHPYIRINGKLEKASWKQAFYSLKERIQALNPSSIAAVAGGMADVESMLLLKELMLKLGSPHFDCRADGAEYISSNRFYYTFNTTIEGIGDSDCCLLIGTNPRIEAPVLNARIRKRSLQGHYPIGVIGNDEDLTYSYTALGSEVKVLEAILKGTHPFAEVLKNSQKPMMILGSGVFKRKDSLLIQQKALEIAEKYGFVKEDWAGYNVLHYAASRVGGLDIGFVPQDNGVGIQGLEKAIEEKQIQMLYLLDADCLPSSLLEKTFVIYQGHHGDKAADYADVILPGAAYTEKTATYVNTEGRPQKALMAMLPRGEAKEDWRILRALSESLGCTLPYDHAADITKRLEEINPLFKHYNHIQPTTYEGIPEIPSSITFEVKDLLPFFESKDYYQTDSISRASTTMALCKKARLNEMKEERQVVNG